LRRGKTREPREKTLGVRTKKEIKLKNTLMMSGGQELTLSCIGGRSDGSHQCTNFPTPLLAIAVEFS